MKSSSLTPSPEPSLTVYFDGACPVCSREIAMYRRQPGSEACVWVDASRCSASELGPGLDSQRALARMHVRQADGRLVSGAAAFILMWQAFPATRWLGRLAALPPLPWVLELGYRLFLRVRPLWRQDSAAPIEPASDAASDAAITPALWAELRSDQAGEAGAVAIYRGILAISRDADVRAFAARHLATEQEHLRLINTWVPASRRSRLLPVWRLAGWTTGALPALAGRRAVYQTIAAVETFVDQHYADQLRMIDALPSDLRRAELRALLAACRADEVEHRDEARQLSQAADSRAMSGWTARVWAAVVGAGSAVGVGLARRF
jgi:3-demethoxyubiquinol 3-hydroxylase